MDHASHAILILGTAILLAGGGIVVLALGWRRRYRGEPSGMVIGTLTARQQVLSLVGIPAAGLAGLLAIVIGAAAMR
jgi:hypothetical protein